MGCLHSSEIFLRFWALFSMGIIPWNPSLTLVEEQSTDDYSRTPLFCWKSRDNSKIVLRLSLLQGEGGNICHYQIDGHKPVYQITAVWGGFNGFFCLQNLSICSFHCGFYAKILVFSRLEIFFFWLNLWLFLILWNLTVIDFAMWKFIIARASLHSELIAHSQAPIIRHVFCALADMCTLRWLK